MTGKKMVKISDIIKTIGLIRLTYPNSYQTKTDKEEQMLYELWFDIFKEYSCELFLTAVKNAIKNSEFAPKPATIIKEIEKMQEAYQKSDTELWAELTSVFYEIEECANRFTYDFIEKNGKTQGENAKIRAQEIFNSLSEELKEYLQNTGALVELALSDNPEYEKGRFMRIMPEIKERVKTRQENANYYKLVSGKQNNLID